MVSFIPLLLASFLILLQLKQVQCRQVQENSFHPGQVKEDNLLPKFLDALNLTRESTEKNKLKPKEKAKAKKEEKNHSGILSLEESSRKILNNRTHSSKAEKLVEIHAKKLKNDLHGDKVRGRACVDSSSIRRKEGEEWYEMKECNSCNCVCKPNGRENCMCTRMGC